MKKATLQDALAAHPCYDKEKIESFFTKRKTLSPRQIAALPIPEEDKVWALTRDFFLDAKDKAVRFAIFCAEQSLSDFEEWCPKDERPRKAIEAAKVWLACSSDAAARAAGAAGAAARAAGAAAGAAGAADAAGAGVAAAWAAWAADAASVTSAAWAADAASVTSAAAAGAAARAADAAGAGVAAAWAAWAADAASVTSAAAAGAAARKEQVKFLVKMLSEKEIK